LDLIGLGGRDGELYLLDLPTSICGNHDRSNLKTPNRNLKALLQEKSLQTLPPRLNTRTVQRRIPVKEAKNQHRFAGGESFLPINPILKD